MRVLQTVALMFLCCAITAGQQTSDPDFKPNVASPAYPNKGPVVAIDEAHKNFHTRTGRYLPFTSLLTADGYTVVSNDKAFTRESLKKFAVVVIANAVSENEGDAAIPEPEVEALYDWVKSGGSLLVMADHAPFGSAAKNLGKRFGTEMGEGFVASTSDTDGNPTTLVFTRENGLLGDHPITRGRNESEGIKKVVAFTGQSLSLPPGATALMKLNTQSLEFPDRETLSSWAKNPSDATSGKSAKGRVQGFAMQVGSGRIVFFGEAGMFSAQVIKFQQDGKEGKIFMGMNVPGNDDQQFALNVLHWLTKKLPAK